MRSARSCVTALIRFTPTRAGSFPVTIRHACIRCGWDSGVCVRRWTCSPRCFPHTPDSTPNCAGLRQNSVRRAIGESGATLDHAGADSNEQELGPIRRACTQMAVANRKRAATAVESVRYTRLILEFTLWLEVKRWRDAMTDEQRAAIEGSARKFAVEVLHSRHRKLIKRGKKLADLDNHHRHRARIAAKKVRYATEFFSHWFPKGRASLRRCTDGPSGRSWVAQRCGCRG